MRILHSGLASALLFSLAFIGAARAGVPYPDKATPQAVDRGPLAALSGTAPISVTIALHLPKLGEAERLMDSIHTPGNPQFHNFLTAAEFASQFAPTKEQVAKVIAGLAKYGLSAQRTTATTLKVTGAAADIERAFSVSLRSYAVPGHGNVSGYSYHAPLTHAVIPAELSTSVAAVLGLDSRPSFVPHFKRATQAAAKAPLATPSSGSGNPPGLWTVTDFANYYDVTPLYSAGVTGKGRTIGIVTLASFTPSDAFFYWNAIGLKVKPNRIKIVNVDDGPGAPSDDSGSDETTLDVQQSGGIAPGAKIIVYQAPNTSQAFVDAFALALEDNSAETISTSWGEWEWLNNLDNNPVTDPTTGRTVGTIQAFHELFVRAALQGQSLFAASGDSGAYDADGICPPAADCSNPLSVDSPASDSAMTAAGGTTLPGLQEYCQNAACTPPYLDINVPNERVWGWDYLEPLCGGLDPISCGIFPAGSGGGVSVFFNTPLYQAFVPGVQRSQPGQDFTFEGELLFALPANFRGRNVPDISFNADPQTGYIIYYTSSVSGPGIFQAGGTSFVAPQLNGVSALYGDLLNGRIGLLNYPLYGLAVSGQAYKGKKPPMHAIAFGNNWFYQGSNGYNPGAGLGTLDVANFAEFLRGLCF